MTQAVRVAQQLPVEAGETVRLTDPVERQRIAAYLRSGALILATTALQADRLDPARGMAVGASYRTDGSWVWSDALTYYVRVHGVAPQPELHDWIRAQDYTCRTPGADAQDTALAVLYRSFE